MRRSAILLCLVTSALPLASARADRIDACRLLSRGQIQASIGEPVIKGRHALVGDLTGDHEAEMSSCYYDTAAHGLLPARSVSLWLRRAPEGRNDAGAVLESFKKTLEREHVEVGTLDGVGDEAFWSNGEMLGHREVRVHVRKGRYVAILTVGGMSDDKTARADAEQLARELIARL